jgi:hypothetical protein
LKLFVTGIELLVISAIRKKQARNKTGQPQIKNQKPSLALGFFTPAYRPILS